MVRPYPGVAVPPAAIYFRVELGNAQAASTYAVRVRRPNGTLADSFSGNLAQGGRYASYWFSATDRARTELLVARSQRAAASRTALPAPGGWARRNAKLARVYSRRLITPR